MRILNARNKRRIYVNTVPDDILHAQENPVLDGVLENGEKR